MCFHERQCIAVDTSKCPTCPLEITHPHSRNEVLRPSIIALFAREYIGPNLLDCGMRRVIRNRIIDSIVEAQKEDNDIGWRALHFKSERMEVNAGHMVFYDVVKTAVHTARDNRPTYITEFGQEVYRHILPRSQSQTGPSICFFMACIVFKANSQEAADQYTATLKTELEGRIPHHQSFTPLVLRDAYLPDFWIVGQMCS
jgi:hypothetical protein